MLKHRKIKKTFQYVYTETGYTPPRADASNLRLRPLARIMILLFRLTKSEFYVTLHVFIQIHMYLYLHMYRYKYTCEFIKHFLGVYERERETIMY